MKKYIFNFYIENYVLIKKYLKGGRFTTDMTLTLTFLGTGSMVPTKERNVQSMVLEYEGELILVDCGEGTQRQMNIAGYSRAKVRKILLTHWHGDHVSGLIGLIQTIFNSDYQHTLQIYGPKGTKERMRHLQQTVDFENKVSIEIHELTPKKDEILDFYENELYRLSCARVDHSSPTIAYVFREKDKRRVVMATAKKIGLKSGPLIGRLQRGESVTFKGELIKADDVTFLQTGKKIAFIPDTAINDMIPVIAKDADVMVCESTYGDEHEEKARQYKHLTATQASLLAQQAEAQQLFLTHFSQRYTSVEPLLEQAKVHFQKTRLAYDFLKITL